MTELPSDIQYGYVEGRYLLAVADTLEDTDTNPDAVPAQGEVLFTPRTTLRRSLTIDPATILKQTIIVPLDSQGRVSLNGQGGVWLVTGQYDVTFRFSQGTVTPFRIEVTPEHTVENPLDLTIYMPVPIPPGAVTVVSEATRIAAEEARDQAVAAAALAQEASATASGVLDSAQGALDDIEAAQQAATTAQQQAEAALVSANEAVVTATTARDEAAAAAESMATAVANAVAAQEAAELAQSAAEIASTSATTSEEDAQIAQVAAEAARDAAQTAETAATAARSEAIIAEANAQEAEGNARAAQTAAEEARDAAQTALTAAETAADRAEAAQAGAEAARDAAATAQIGAEAAQTGVTEARDAAQASATAAATSETNAVNSATAAGESADAAENSALAAATSASTASTASTEAQEARDDAQLAESGAITARDAAAVAQGAAETARTGAEAAQTAAETASTAASDAQTASESVQSAVFDARDAAQTSESNAATSAAASGASATAAADSATGAETSASAAAESETAARSAQEAAQLAETGAASARDAALSAQTGAETARTEAETAQNAAEAARDGMVVSGAVDGDNLVLERLDGTTVTAGNVRGPKGDAGTGLEMAGSVPTQADLPVSAADGEGYFVTDTGHLWVWSATEGTWIDGGKISGPQGPEGQSPYEIAVENGFTGTESDWLESLKGEAGTTTWAGITDKPTEFPPEAHGHDYSEISGTPPAPDLSGFVEDTDPRLSDARVPTAHDHDDRYYTETEVDTLIEGIDTSWDGITGKPTTFPPDAHRHDYNEIDGTPPAPDLSNYVETTDPRLSDARTPTAHTHDDRYYTETEVDTLIGEIDTSWDDITDKPTEFPPATHTHPEYVNPDLSGYALKTEIPDTSGFLSSVPDEYVTDTELGAALAGKQDAGDYALADHTHPEYVNPDVSTFVETTDPRLSDARTPITHSHSQDEVADLVETLAGKQDSGDYIEEGDTRLSDARTPTQHSHPQDEVEGLTDALGGKADTDHNHDTRYYTQSQVDALLAEKTAILVLAEGDPLPSGTTDGTIIARTS